MELKLNAKETRIKANSSLMLAQRLPWKEAGPTAPKDINPKKPLKITNQPLLNERPTIICFSTSPTPQLDGIEIKPMHEPEEFKPNHEPKIPDQSRIPESLELLVPPVSIMYPVFWYLLDKCCLICPSKTTNKIGNFITCFHFKDN